MAASMFHSTFHGPVDDVPYIPFVFAFVLPFSYCSLARLFFLEVELHATHALAQVVLILVVVVLMVMGTLLSIPTVMSGGGTGDEEAMTMMMPLSCCWFS